MQELNYTCPKCKNTQCDVGEFPPTGGFLSKIKIKVKVIVPPVRLDPFTTVTCTNCHYTEIYKAPSSMLGNIFDLFTN